MIEGRSRVRVRISPVEWLAGGLFIHRDLGMHESLDRLAVVGGHGEPDQQAVVSRANVAVPAAPENGIPLPHQEAVARVGRRRGIVPPAMVERSESQFVAAVVHVIEQTAIAGMRQDRLE